MTDKRIEYKPIDVFENDLCRILDILEKLCFKKVAHIEYVQAYKEFVEKWGPKDER